MFEKLTKICESVTEIMEVTFEVGYKRHSHIVTKEKLKNEEYHDNHVLRHVGYVPDTQIALYEVDTEWVEVALEDVNGNIVAIDNRVIVSCSDIDGENSAIIVSGRYNKLIPLHQQVLMAREVMLYTYMTEVAPQLDKSLGSTVNIKFDPKKEGDNEVVLANHDAEFRVMSWLYAAYGDPIVDDALLKSSRNYFLDEFSMKQYRATHGIRGWLRGYRTPENSKVVLG